MIGRHRSVEGYGQWVISVSSGRPSQPSMLLDLLEDFAEAPAEYVRVMPLVLGRVHLADELEQLDDRVTELFVSYVERLVSDLMSIERQPPISMVFNICAYQLTNAVFVKLRDRQNLASWVRRHARRLDERFVEGLDALAGTAPALLDNPQGVSRLRSALEDLKHEITVAKRQ